MKAKTILVLLLVSLCSASFADVYKTNVHASYYADKFHGRQTASGEIFNMNDFTCAHKTLAFGTILRVTNLENNRSVDVRVNDRGPFVAGREIDLSKAAARQLDMIRTGTATVRIEVLSAGNGAVAKTAPQAKPVVETIEQPVVLVNAAEPVELTAVFWDVQVGSFSSQENANRLAQELLRSGFENVYFQKTSQVTRVVIKRVPNEQLKATEEKLRSFGVSDYVVKKNS